MFQRSTVSSQTVSTKNVPFYARSGNNLRKRILILPFLDEKKTRSQRVKKLARYTVVKELLKTKNFVIVRNSDFPRDFANFINNNEEYDLAEISKIAAGMGIAAIIEGKILEIQAKKVGDQVGLIRNVKAQISTNVRIRMVAARNGKVILNELRKATVESTATRVAEYSFSDRYLEEDPKLIQLSVAKAFKGSVRSVILAAEKISWKGRIALVSGDRIYINAGRLSGLQIGDILKVTELGTEVFDPETGTFIGNAPGRMKGTVEIVSYFGKDGAISIIHSGSGFQENDQVQLY